MRLETILFLLFIISLSVFTYILIIDEVNECTSDPINYGVEKITQEQNVDNVLIQISRIYQSGQINSTHFELK